MNQRTPADARLLHDMAVLTAEALRLALPVADRSAYLLDVDRRYSNVVSGPLDLDPARLEADGWYAMHEAFARIARPVIVATGGIPLPVGSPYGIDR